MKHESIFEIDGKKIFVREKLYAKDWNLFIAGSKIIGDIRAKKTNIDKDQKEIIIDTGDFNNEQYLEFAACGFIDGNGNNVTPELCAKMPLEVSLKGFAFFLFVLINLNLSSIRSMNLKEKL